MADEKKVNLGHLKKLAQSTDERLDDLEETDAVSVLFTAQALTEDQKAQARANIGAAAEGHTHTAITTAQIDAILDA